MEGRVGWCTSRLRVDISGVERLWGGQKGGLAKKNPEFCENHNFLPKFEDFSEELIFKKYSISKGEDGTASCTTGF